VIAGPSWLKGYETSPTTHSCLASAAAPSIGSATTSGFSSSVNLTDTKRIDCGDQTKAGAGDAEDKHTGKRARGGN
jgi:hypothetical protein